MSGEKCSNSYGGDMERPVTMKKSQEPSSKLRTAPADNTLPPEDAKEVETSSSLEKITTRPIAMTETKVAQTPPEEATESVAMTAIEVLELRTVQWKSDPTISIASVITVTCFLQLPTVHCKSHPSYFYCVYDMVVLGDSSIYLTRILTFSIFRVDIYVS